MTADDVVPAPWRLRFEGVVLLLAARTRAAAAPGLFGRWSAVALLDYAESPVGPYRELLHIPRIVRRPGACGPTVRDIWVTSAASARSGNANWGLTKSVVAVDRSRPEPGAERWIVTDADRTLAAVTHRPRGSWLPVGKPAWLAPLVQVRGGAVFRTRVTAWSAMRVTRVSDAALYPGLVVDLTQHRIVAAVALRWGHLRFDAARVTPLRRPA